MSENGSSITLRKENFTLKGEVLLTDPKYKRFGLEITEWEKDAPKRNATYYLELAEGKLFFSDVVTERFFSLNRYPDKFHPRPKTCQGTYRDLRIGKSGRVSILNDNKEKNEKVTLIFPATYYELAIFSQHLLDYLEAKRLSWAFHQALKPLIEKLSK